MEGANQESPFKLPLAPTIVSSDRLSKNAATFSSGRRGSSIFSPAKTLDQTHNNNNNHTKLNLDPSSSDSDPPHPSTIVSAGGVNATQLIPQNPPPPPAPPQEVAKTRPPATVIRYKECLKNHAANMGGHALDGCGEFMPGGGEEDSPEFLRCAACHCHRNFHRKEVEGQPQCYNNNNNNASYTRNLASTIPTHHHHRDINKDSSLQGFAANTTTTTPRMMSFGGGNLGNGNYESSSEDLNNALEGSSSMLGGQSPKKRRFRTKFSQEQKDKMHEFASKLGWRIQRQDQEEVTRFCNEVGLRRQVFKVWMHNNKQQQQQAIKRKSSSHEEIV